ncbi:SGNH hydrolase-type esterase domain-containing protein [Cadophora sp. MPI-SDFR-AT-0126]|nr:SGNH hydrolase-type esterase domain-containing protein [Leotiomycetes sp. MPI-SDFR-AT-0126]
MKLFSSLCLLLAGQIVASPTPHKQKNAAFFLAGDSTTAINGGWGNGFITTITKGSFGINYGKSGATTVSFRAVGLWHTTVASVAKASELGYLPFVTIQFGHNDQKAAANISIELFTANLETFAKEVLAAGGTPIMTTSLTRRGFNSTTGKVIENLAEQAAATISLAKSLHVPYIDLNRASTDYINSIGSPLADTYNLSPDDRTHLNPNGELLFGTMVSTLISSELKDGRKWTRANATIAAALASGTYILPTPLEGTTNSTAPPNWAL